MSPHLITSLFVLKCFIVCAQVDDTATLNVILENCSNEKGKVLVSVHNASTFYDQKPPFWAERTAKSGVLSFTFNLLKDTPYAVMILHDENENYRMDFTLLGIPKEDAANSGQRNKFGPPRFDLAKFELKKDSLIRLRF